MDEYPKWISFKEFRLVVQTADEEAALKDGRAVVKTIHGQFEGGHQHSVRYLTAEELTVKAAKEAQAAKEAAQRESEAKEAAAREARASAKDSTAKGR